MSNASAQPLSPASIVATTPSASKARSCAVCRQRRVRCDKQQPCGNCRKGGIPCTLPPRDRQPRWARRLERERLSNNAGAVKPSTVDSTVDKAMERVHNLENLVKELRSQLEHAQALAGPTYSSGSSPASSAQHRESEHSIGNSPGADNSSVNAQLGRLVLQDTVRSHYVTGGFWSRIDDELDALKMDIHDPSTNGETSSSDDDDKADHEDSRPSSRSHAWPLRDTAGTDSLKSHELHPLPSQIPFLLETYFENVAWIMHVVHVPTIVKMFRDVRSHGVAILSPHQEALAFSIYYAAIASMEDDEVMNNFADSKDNLTQKYRDGMEIALGKADYLNAPNLTTVQAFAIYLCLARRSESPRYVWMLVGLSIRMATFIGLQRDGSHFENLSPFEIEMRRRTWWFVCMLDLKAAEDQGTEPVIKNGSFDTNMPLNINDVDISPETKGIPKERHSISDMTPLRIQAGVTNVSKQMMALSGQQWAAMDDQSRLVSELYRKFEHEYFRHVTDPNEPNYATANVVARLVMSKMTLIAFLPVLLSSSSEHLTEAIRLKLLVAAIEVSEYNHQLNSEPTWKKWRWLYQTHTHWYAIVFLMIELGRRPWSPIVERGWAILHSDWLFPAEARSGKSKTLRIWVPLRKLMAKLRKHRADEIERLRKNPQDVARLQAEDEHIALPASPEPFSNESQGEDFRKRWRKLFTQDAGGTHLQGHVSNIKTSTAPPADPAAYAAVNLQIQYQPQHTDSFESQPSMIDPGVSYSYFHTLPKECTTGPEILPDPWPSLDGSFDEFLNMDLDVAMGWNDDMNWFNWTQTARNMESGSSDVPFAQQ